MTNWMLADALGIRRRHEQRETPVYSVFVRDLVLPFRIGIYDYEKRAPQQIRVTVELVVEALPANDDFCTVVNYETIVEGVKALARGGHIELVETLGERILDFCLEDPRVRSAQVTIEKLDVYTEAGSVGVIMKRRRGKTHICEE
jgi:7,8-dihydroneopterin aldolase/epimerase/oxygenase